MSKIIHYFIIFILFRMVKLYRKGVQKGETNYYSVTMKFSFMTTLLIRSF